MSEESDEESVLTSDGEDLVVGSEFSGEHRNQTTLEKQKDSRIQNLFGLLWVFEFQQEKTINL